MDAISTLTSACELVFQIKEVWDNIQSAPAGIRDVHEELDQLCSVLEKIKDLIPAKPSSGTDAEEGEETELYTIAKIGPVLNSCNKTFDEIRELVQKHVEAVSGKSSMRRKFTSFKWTMKEKELGDLKTKLGNQKATLELSLLMLVYIQSRDIAESEEKIEATTSEINDKTNQLTETANAIRIDTASTSSSQVRIEEALEKVQKLLAAQATAQSKPTTGDSSPSDNNGAETSDALQQYLATVESVVHNPDKPLFPTLTPRTPIEELGEYFTSRDLPSEVKSQLPSLPTAIQIATRNHRLSSGFPYPWSLQPLDITARDWLMFTQTLTDSGKLSSADEALANGAAVGATFVPGGALLAMQTRKAVLKARTAKQISKEMQALDEFVKGWNEEFFGKRGLSVYFEVPGSENWREAGVVDEDGFCELDGRDNGEKEREEEKEKVSVGVTEVEILPDAGKKNLKMKKRIVGKYDKLKERYETNEYFGKCRLVVVPAATLEAGGAVELGA